MKLHYLILLMEEILHHLGIFKNLANNGDKLPTSTGDRRISSITWYASNFTNFTERSKLPICQEALPMMKRARCNFVGRPRRGFWKKTRWRWMVGWNPHPLLGEIIERCMEDFGLEKSHRRKMAKIIFLEIWLMKYQKFISDWQLFLAALVANPGKSVNRG